MPNIMKLYTSILTVCLIIIGYTGIQAQNIDFNKNSSLGNLYIRMYGELHYYQPVDLNTYAPGKFDAKRIVALFGYQFDRNTQFVTEWELEHANEIYLEQAFVKHKIKGNLSIKAGMILVPMGIINENHEPNNFYSVDRPNIDQVIVPSTWRDMGAGITGLFPSLDLRYQLYLVNGLLGYKSGSAKFNSSSNYRSGRQKGIKTIFSTFPALSGQLEYYGFTNGKMGVSIYSGESNTDAYSGLDKSNEQSVIEADSTTVYTNMIGLHSSNKIKKWNLKTQLLFAYNSGTDAYNVKGETDLGKASLGMYTELGRHIDKNEKWLIFGRYSYWDNQIDKNTRVNGLNPGLHHVFTTGINYFAAKGAVFKIDAQVTDFHADAKLQINTGVGVWF